MDVKVGSTWAPAPLYTMQQHFLELNKWNLPTVLLVVSIITLKIAPDSGQTQ